jgi:hypothetical protein
MSADQTEHSFTPSIVVKNRQHLLYRKENHLSSNATISTDLVKLSLLRINQARRSRGFQADLVRLCSE